MKHGERVKLFRDRLSEVIDNSGFNHSGFATSIGVDRSTLSQLLSVDDVRLPRADTIASIAENHQVSIDWLLGITQERVPQADILPGPMEIEDYTDSLLNKNLLSWHQEAAGYKVRYVPTTLPDFLKTDGVVNYEFSRYGSGKSSQSIHDAHLLLVQQQHPDSEMEVCQSIQSVQGFALGEGVWKELPAASRRKQLEYMIGLSDELYPGFRWFLYDGKQAYSVPFTVFGPMRVVLFVGQIYIILNRTDHIRWLTGRFDNLIRMAVVQPHEITSFLKKLLESVK